MNLILGNKKRKRVIIRVLLLGLIMYAGYLIVNQQLQIKEKSDNISLLNQKLSTQKMKNEEIRKALESSDEADLEYIEKVARNNLHFAKRGERIFMNSAGS